MAYRAVLFDLDGTLADTLEDIAAAGNYALSQLGRPTFPLERYRYLAGQGAEWLIRAALGPEHESLVPRGLQLFKEHYAEHEHACTKLYPGIPKLLDELRRRGLKLAVLSNKPHLATEQVLQRFCDKWKFDAIFGHRQTAKLKPDPSSAIEIADTLGIPPAEWMYLGDTRVDMLTARGAGMFAVGVLWGFRDEPELREAGAQAMIRQPGEALSLLEASS
jgi:phosphoglycolate phosphatase